MPAGDQAGRAGAAAGASSRRTLPRIFKNELALMMYGFGDSKTPNPESIALMEELVLEYLATTVKHTTEIAHAQRRERPDVVDVKLVIRKDRRKMQRVRYLLEMRTRIEKDTSLQAETLIEK